MRCAVNFADTDTSLVFKYRVLARDRCIFYHYLIKLPVFIVIKLNGPTVFEKINNNNKKASTDV